WKWRRRDKFRSRRAGSLRTRTIAKACRWKMHWRRRSRKLRPARATQSRNAKTHTKWRRRTARLRILDGKDYGDGDDGTGKSFGEKSKLARSQVPAGTNAEHRDRSAYRRRQDHDHRARAVLYRHDSQDGRGARGHHRHRLDGTGA